MSATTPRYTYDGKRRGKSGGKKVFLQTAVSLAALCGVFFAYRSDAPYSESLKLCVRRTLSESTDIGKVKNFAEYAVKKSGLDKTGIIKNIFGDEESTENAEIENPEADGADIAEAAQAVQDEKIDVGNSVAAAVQKNEIPAFRNPAEGRISEVFGKRVHPITGEENNMHTGIDIAGKLNQTVISAAEGRVIKTAEDNSNGKYVMVEHSGGYTTAYAHLNEICVTEGEYVDGNTKIGLMGQSGSATGVHLHFEIKKDGERINPEEFLRYD